MTQPPSALPFGVDLIRRVPVTELGDDAPHASDPVGGQDGAESRGDDRPLGTAAAPISPLGLLFLQVRRRLHAYELTNQTLGQGPSRHSEGRAGADEACPGGKIQRYGERRAADPGPAGSAKSI